MPPITSASTKPISTPMVPTAREVQIACSVREKMSFPALSVPNRWIEPWSTPNRWVVNGMPGTFTCNSVPGMSKFSDSSRYSQPCTRNST